MAPYVSPDNVIESDPKKRRRSKRSRAKAYKRAYKQEIRAGKRAVRKAIRQAGRSESQVKKYQARRKVINYAVGGLSAQGYESRRPTIENITTAWPSLTPAERQKIGPKLVRRAASEYHGEYGSTKKLPSFLRKYDPAKYDKLLKTIPQAQEDAAAQAAVDAAAADDLGRAIAVGTAVVPLGGVLKAAKLGSAALKARKAATVTKGAAPAAKAAPTIAKTSRAKTVVQSAKARTAAPVARATRAAQGTRTAKLAQKAGATRAGRAATTTLKGTAKVASLPVRKPLKTAAVYELGAGGAAAISSGGDPDAIVDALVNFTGPAKDLLEQGSSFLQDKGIVGRAAADLLELPAQVVPSTVILGDALIKNAQGDGEALDKLIEDYKESSPIVAAAGGDIGEAFARLAEHPVYGALELSGAKAVAGRGTGMALRGGLGGSAGKRLAGTKRPPLRAGGGHRQERSYSGDVVNKAIQVGLDKRRARRTGGQRATPREAGRITNREFDYLNEAQHNLSRKERADLATKATKELKPRRGVDQKGADLAMRGIITSVRTFKQDIAKYRSELDASLDDLIARREAARSPEERRVAAAAVQENRRLTKDLDRIEKRGDPAVIMDAGQAAARMQKAEVEPEMVEAGVATQEQLDRASLNAAARVHLGAKYGKVEGEGNKAARLLDRDGNPYELDRLKKDLREVGIDPDNIGFLTNRPRANEREANYRVRSERQSLGNQRLSGQSTLEGQFTPRWENIINQLQRGKSISQAVKSFDEMIQHFAAKRGGTLVQRPTWNEAAELGQQMRGVKGQKYVPVRLAKFAAKADELQRIYDIHDEALASRTPDVQREQGLAEAWNEAISKSGEGPFALIPENIAKRMDDAFRAPTNLDRTMQLYSQKFKNAVLPWSVKWIPGNFIDINIRSMLTGSAPLGGWHDRRIGARQIQALKDADPRRGAIAEQVLNPGAHIASQRHLEMHRGAATFDASTTGGRFMRALGEWWERPTPKKLADANRRWREDVVYKFNDRVVENPADLQQLGKSVRRELRENGKTWMQAWKAEDEALADLANGLLETPAQIKFAKQKERVLGQWSGSSPTLRRVLTGYAPFGLWLRAATKFVFLTLPVHHPIKTAIGAQIARMTQEEREALGLSFFADRRLPDNLQGSVPLPGGGIVPVQGLTSFGMFSDPGKSVAGSVIPQISGPLDALDGLEWTGQQLAHEDGSPLNQQERWLRGFISGVEGMTGWTGLSQRAIEQGSTAFNPFKPLDPGTTDWLRDYYQSQNIRVPIAGATTESSSPESSSSGGSSVPWAPSSGSSSSSGSSIPWAP